MSVDALRQGALDGVVVLELGHGIAGAFAARLLGDLGADVIKVEKPGTGDFVRALPPFASHEDGGERSALFEYLNWNKRGVALDLDQAAARGHVNRLADRADIVVESLAPGRLDDWGLSPAALRSRNPRLVVTSVSSFGRTGPYADWLGSDLVFAAMSGVAQISGSADREPLKRGLRQSLYCAGINAAYASLAGHLATLRTGGGAHLDLAIRECPASELVLAEAFYMCCGAIQGRRPATRDPLGGPLGGGDPLPAGAGHLALQVTPQCPVEALARLLDEPRLAEPRFATSESRAANAAELVSILSGCVEQRDPRELFEAASREGLLCGVVQGAADLLACPQLRARGVFATVPGLGSLEFPTMLAGFSRTPAQIRRPAPSLGEHTDEVLSEIPRQRGPAPSHADDRAATTATLRGPLSGLRVLDLSYVFAAPYVGGLLADLGAEVLKVEAPHRLDQSRTIYSPFFENEPGEQSWNRAGAFHVVNRGKRSLSLDLATPAGREILRRLVHEADVLIENYTPRVMRGWGMTYDELAVTNPGLVMLSNTGFGATGPWSAFRAQGTTLEATMGLSRYAGYADGPPSKVGQSYPDFLACWTGLLAVTAALVHRERTGEGQWIDLGMYELGAAVLPEAVLAVQLGVPEPRRSSAGEPDARFGGIFRAAGEDRWLAVSALSDAQLAALQAVLGGVEPQALADTLDAWSRQREALASATTLQAAGIPAGPVLDACDLLDDPQLRHRGFHEWAACADGVERPLIGRPYSWHAETTVVAIAGAGPDFGEAGDYVLEETLGLDREQIRALRADGVVTSAPVGVAPAPAHDLALMRQAGAIARLDPDYRRVHLPVPGAEQAVASTTPTESEEQWTLRA